MVHSSNPSHNAIRLRNLAIIVAPLITLLFLIFVDLDPEHPEITKMAAIAILMAIWWITEAIPLAVTALLPVALFPLLGIMTGKKVAPLYFNHVIFLFIGGFIVALAMEKWSLHKRIALKVILLMGASPRRILFGFMFASAFLSMWISNTATTMMMVPIVLAIILKLEENIEDVKAHRFALALMLGVAYAASIGGMATLIGTPPNLSFARIYSIYFPSAPEISFAAWFAFALPLSIVFFLLVWGFLSTIFCPRKSDFSVDGNLLKAEYNKLGPFAYEEKMVLIVFTSMALLWLTRSGISIGDLKVPGWSALLQHPKMVDDGTVAIMMALILFLIPAKGEGGEKIMDWGTVSKLPWGIVLLFGGGFALAGGFKASGLSLWVGDALAGLGGVQPAILILAICLTVTFLTELTSNTATTEMILPILAGLAIAIKVDPLLLMVPATLSASCAFALPVATPPNAIIFGTGRIKVAEMARVGLLLNLIGAVLVTLAIYTSGKAALGIDLHKIPEYLLK
ncbi:MAG: SLC13/DASS family transporter [Proteobacteria bacterium]|nr:SLC13/DASS family transporter [Pseudomonadota bacterium]